LKASKICQIKHGSDCQSEKKMRERFLLGRTVVRIAPSTLTNTILNSGLEHAFRFDGSRFAHGHLIFFKAKILSATLSCMQSAKPNGLETSEVDVKSNASLS